MKYFCTYFDQNYFSRAIALYNSLLRWCGDFRLFALCLDQASYDAVLTLGLPQIIPVSLDVLESSDKALLTCKSNRSLVEYYWTCGPAFILYLLKSNTAVDLITYLDADMFFFSSLEPLYAEMRDYSIGIVEHRFAKRFENRRKFGTYNVGVLMFKNDENARGCLLNWAAQCVAWCYDKIEQDRYGDQKYLDYWPEKFKGVHVIRHKGVNLAPWNISNYHITKYKNVLWVDEEPLICFHFHGLKEIYSWLFDINLGKSGVRPSHVVYDDVFKSYIAELKKVRIFCHHGKSIRKPTDNLLLRVLKKLYHVCCGVVSGSYVLFLRKKA